MRLDTFEKIKEFSEVTPSMNSAFREVVDEWSPELPPLTILFAAIGNAFINEFDSTKNQKSRMVFDAVEAMLRGENEELDIGAATGFLEAIASKSSFTKTAKTMLGEESRSFLRDMNRFMGICDRDI